MGGNNNLEAASKSTGCITGCDKWPISVVQYSTFMRGSLLRSHPCLVGLGAVRVPEKTMIPEAVSRNSPTFHHPEPAWAGPAGRSLGSSQLQEHSPTDEGKVQRRWQYCTYATTLGGASIFFVFCTKSVQLFSFLCLLVCKIYEEYITKAP